MATYFYYIDHFRKGTSLLPHSDIFLLHRLFKLGAEAVSKRKHFAKAAKPLRGRKERHGYVILVSNEPRCCHAATSERRRIRLKADYYYIALRGASIRRSQRGNSEAVFFRGTLPRRCSIRRSRWDNTLTAKHDYCHYLPTHSPTTLHYCATTTSGVSAPSLR